MTTAHRPTFDPARGKEALRGPAYHQRLLPAHTQLKFRQPGQEAQGRDLAAELLAAEAAHFAKKRGNTAASTAALPDDEGESEERGMKRLRLSPALPRHADEEEDDMEAKRRRVLAETRDIDADSDSESSSEGSGDGSGRSDSEDDSEDDDDDDEQAELMRELERVRREKLARREKEEAERRRAEEDARARDIALGNPLLNETKATDFTVKRRWDDDVVFKNQARGADEKGRPREFVNDMLRSDFHRRFMSKYVK